MSSRSHLVECRRLIASDEAATGVEYAVLLSLIIATAVGAITSFGTSAGGLWGGIEQLISSAMGY